VILIGGTFDPPHIGHVKMAEQARLLAPEPQHTWLLFVPAARSPLKSTTPGASDKDRIEMLRLAIAGLERAAIWTDEIDRANWAKGAQAPSYTIDTLRRLRSIVGPRCDVILLIGADQAAHFHKWKQFRDILTLARPVVALRAPIADATALTEAMKSGGAWSGRELEQWAATTLDVVAPASSTALRETIHQGTAPASEDLDPRVAAYIAGHGLYR
jgi:nicotinate-nucleotide adenylyltransferase